MATYHIVNGDCLAEQLRQTKNNQDLIVCRECLIDGNVKADTIADFWEVRAKYISDNYTVSDEEYRQTTLSEFEKISELQDNAEVCLWFEDDLFCQTNMWFVISLLAKHQSLSIYRVFPTIENTANNWKGFGAATAEELERAYSSKIKFESEDRKLGEQLWTAYQNGDLIQLKALAHQKSDCFHYLEEVCQAHIDRFPSDNSPGRPEKVVKEIIETYSREFQAVFSMFSEREGIYGFGDSQLKQIYSRLLQHN